ncbi:MAG: hypothetical protein IKI31_04565, partial [Treponema sp.]|nr:hypothetical protein [Treponema sp.]
GGVLPNFKIGLGVQYVEPNLSFSILGTDNFFRDEKLKWNNQFNISSNLSFSKKKFAPSFKIGLSFYEKTFEQNFKFALSVKEKNVKTTTSLFVNFKEKNAHYESGNAGIQFSLYLFSKRVNYNGKFSSSVKY